MAAGSHRARLVSALETAFQATFPSGAWQQSPNHAVVLPIMTSGETGRSGFLIAGLNPFRLFGAGYRGWYSVERATPHIRTFSPRTSASAVNCPYPWAVVVLLASLLPASICWDPRLLRFMLRLRGVRRGSGSGVLTAGEPHASRPQLQS
jgi:hypothetical protein